MDLYQNKKALDELSSIYLQLDEISADTALDASKGADKKRGQLAAAGDKEGAAKKAKQASDLRNPTKFRSFDDKLAAACKKIATGKAAREIKRVEHELEREDKLMGGREMLRIIYDCFEINLSDQVMIDWRDMQAIKYRGDLARFHTEWTETLLDLRNVPDEMILHDCVRTNDISYPP